MKKIFFFLYSLFPILGFSQSDSVNILFMLKSAEEPVFMASNMNGWNPGDSKYAFLNNSLSLRLRKGQILEYKLTKGNWGTVEKDGSGNHIPNRKLMTFMDTSVTLEPMEWNQEVTPALQTRTTQVRILDTAMFIPGLKRTRRVWIYLPKDYEETRKRYKVLYLQDGQNMFDRSTAAFGEWGVDEAMDSLDTQHKHDWMVVAVDHGSEKRINEYNPYTTTEYGLGEGDAFADFLANHLKPLIDKKFRTKKEARYTAIAGSSMGGVISLYTIARYPSVFGSAGIFSPAFWVSKPLFDYVQSRLPAMRRSKVWLYAGGKESPAMITDAEKMLGILKKKRSIKTSLIIDQEALHNEAAWAKWFPIFAVWLNEVN